MRNRVFVVVVAALALVMSGCDWAQYLGVPEHTGSTVDWSVAHDDVAAHGLVQAWTGGGSVWDGSSPVVAGGRVFIGAGGTGGMPGALQAFDAGGAGCTGVPASCRPLWTATTGVTSVGTAVSGGTVFTGWSDDVVGYELAAYDAAGSSGCTGTPKVCTPLWTSSTGGYLRSDLAPTVAGNLVFMPFDRPDGAGVAAFDTAGVKGCSGTPKRCAPQWTAVTAAPPVASATVAQGMLYVQTGSGLAVFDAAGVIACSGSPKRCAPLWTGPTGNSTPVVAGGLVYITTGGGFSAVDAAGVNGCSGVPKTCAPLWTASTTGATGTPVAVASGRVFAVSTTYHPGDPGADTSDLQAFDAAGNVACAGTPKRCSALWTARLPGGTASASPSVASGVVYIGTQTWLIKAGPLSAYDAAGEIGCSGTPRTCRPMAQASTLGIGPSSVAVANGFVYVVGSFDGLIAFRVGDQPSAAGATTRR